MDPLRRAQQLFGVFNTHIDTLNSTMLRSSAAAPIRSTRVPELCSLLTVPRGQFTFDLEGIEGPGRRFHSRTASVPRADSGITIGRGFDLGQFSPNEINKILVSAGFAADFISNAKGASGLEGDAAQDYLESNPFRDITLHEQWQLFNNVRNRMELDVRRISSKSDTIATYGVTDWDKLSRTTQDLVVDLRYRGDYSPKTRELIQPALVNNDIWELARVLGDQEYWVESRGVPRERFLARKEFAESQLRSPMSFDIE